MRASGMGNASAQGANQRLKRKQALGAMRSRPLASSSPHEDDIVQGGEGVWKERKTWQLKTVIWGETEA